MFENKMQNFRGSSEGLKGDLLKDFGSNENESHFFCDKTSVG
jgi:hypothetical protein